MKRLLLIAFCLFIHNVASAQTYISLVPSITNGIGTLPEKSNFSFEVGRQWDVFSLGLDVGKTSLGKVVGRDTTVYLEVRPNLNVFQEGKFTNTITPGVGVIFNSKENFMTEFTTGIEYSYSQIFHINVFFGQYYYSGRYAASDVTFWGLSVMFYLSPNHSRAVFNKETVNKK